MKLRFLLKALTLLALGACSMEPVLAADAQGGNPCRNPQAYLQMASGATSGTSAVEIIANVATQQVYVCSLSVEAVSGTTPTFSLVSGTGTNCATNQATVFAALTTTSTNFYSFPEPVSHSPGALCYKNTGTTPIQNYWITYVQQ